MKRFLLLLLLSAAMPLQAASELVFLEYERNEFQPSQGQVFKLPFYLPSKSNVKIQIFTPDHDLIREISSPGALEAGKHTLSWDGKDGKGVVVANEAYYPTLQATDVSSKKVLSFSPKNTGGKVVEKLRVNITSEKHISFSLDSPSRVIARVGIKGGPLLRTLSNWQPRNTGKVVLRWDGFDEDRLRDIRTDQRLAIMVRAYQLPDFSIITSGNDASDYRKYRASLNLTEKSADVKQVLEVDGKRIERHYYFAKDINLNPDVEVAFVDSYPQDSKGLPIIDCPCPIRVNLSDKMKAQLQESLYEIAFFVDDEFVSEQEQGYVPFTWRWTPSSLEKGAHTLTVNVSGLRGEVGVKSLGLVVK